jgi:hypothetical protein
MKMSRHRRPSLRVAIITIFVVVPLVGARADDSSLGIASSSELDRIMQDNANRQAVIETAREQNAQLPNACDSATYTETSHTVLNPPHVDRTGKLIGGEWLQSVIATGCGTRRQLNILTQPQHDGALSRIALLPGTTIADPLLQRDAIQYVMVQAHRLIPPDCTQARVVETRFVEFEENPLSTVHGRKVRPWREDWRVEGCGKRVIVPVRFVPDSSGTTIHATRAIQAE